MPRGDLPASIAYSDTSDKPVLPDERFANAAQVRDLCQEMIRADRTRAWMRDRVDGLVNGWPSYPKSIAAAKGFGWFPRVNYREAEGLIAAQQTPLYDLLTEVDHCMEIDLDIPLNAGVSQDQIDDWQNTIQQSFTWLMFKRWRTSFNFHLNLSNREMLVHGLGAHVWPNDNWEGRTPRTGQILFPEGVSLDFNRDGEYFMLRDFVPGINVYEFIRNEEAAKKKGWFPDNVWKTLANATKQNQKIQTEDLGDLQRKVRRGDLGYWGTSQVGLWLNWVFVREYEGGISLYCIEENITAGTKDKGYLFKKRFMFDDFPLTLWPYDIGNGDLHSIVGLGWRTKDFFELSNRINNAMAVQILISALPQVKQTQPNIDPEKLKLARMGALSILPYGLDAALQQFPPLNNSGLALQRHLKDTLNDNNQSVAGGQAPEPKDRETKYSFMLRSHDSARVSNGMQSLYESNLQDYYEKTYRRVLRSMGGGSLRYQKLAKEFRERCLRKGVPDVVLKERAIGEIRQVTSTGAGSAAIRLQAIQLLLNSPVYANASDAKKITIERDLVAATLGGASVDRYARSLKDATPSDIDQSFAAQENNGLAQGGDAVVGDGQNDVMHADAHLAKAEEIMQAVEQQQMDPEKALAALEKLLQHAGQHLAKHGNQDDPAVKELADRWREVARFVNQLAAEVEGNQQQQEQASEQTMLAMRKDEMDNQRKTRKDDMENVRRLRKDAFNERLADARTTAQIRRGR